MKQSLKKYTHFLVFLVSSLLLNTVSSMSSQEAIGVMIKGRDQDKLFKSLSNQKKTHINHELLRANLQEKKLTPLEQKLYDYE
jgi:hypothetical protein